jgi:hypothetical protein
MIKLILPFVAVAGVGIARALYPAENGFSVMTCTLSFLGSPDAHRNPSGWRFYQAGMTSAVLWLAWLVQFRVGKRRGQPARLVAAANTAYGGALALILAAIWIPLSREPFVGGLTYGEIHNPVTFAAIIVMIAAVILDGTSLMLARVQWLLLAPFAALGLVTVAGLVSLGVWRGKCAADPSLRPFPGVGIHSTPLWEWIAFTGLCLFLVSQALACRKLPFPQPTPAFDPAEQRPEDEWRLRLKSASRRSPGSEKGN